MLTLNSSTEEKNLFNLLSTLGQTLDIKVYMIGGIVRDKILNRPSEDIDIAVVGDGIEFAQAVGKKCNLPVVIFKNYGTAMLKYGTLEVEIVGTRKESYSLESRNPKVAPGSLFDDQSRRDFTINTLALSLNKEDFGTIIDPFNGMQDLMNKMIQTPLDPKTTFSDDPLRMMRAIRFATQLGFEIDQNTFNAITQNKQRIEIISQERIHIELNKIILSDKPSIGFDLLYKSGLLQIILPELANLQIVEYIDGKGHKDNFYHTLQVLDSVAVQSKNLWLRWAAILHDVGKTDTKRYDEKLGWTFHGHDALGAIMVHRIFKRLKLPLDHHMKYVQKLVRYHLRPISLTNENITDSAIRRLLVDVDEDLDDLMLLCEADITSKNEKKVKKLLSNYEMVRRKIEEVEAKDHLRNWQPPITGALIMETFDLKPSKIVGELKSEIREAILEGDIKNEFNDAYNFLLSLGEKKGLKNIELIKQIESDKR